LSTEVYAGLDLATRLSGWTIGDGEALPEVGHWSWPSYGDDLGELVDHFDRDFNTTVLARGVTHLCFEGPLLVVHQRGKKARINPHRFMRKIDAVIGHLEWLCLRHGIWCREVDPRDVKRALAGFAGAEKKDQIAAAEKVGLKLCQGEAKDDEADSFGVFLALVADRNKALAERWDRVLYGRRGQLL
jgi:hypothetical protein